MKMSSHSDYFNCLQFCVTGLFLVTFVWTQSLKKIIWTTGDSILQTECTAITQPTKSKYLPTNEPAFYSHYTGQPCLQCFDAVGWAAGRASGL